MADKLISELAKGAWSGATAYTVGDIVDSDSSSYVCIANNTNQEPPNATYWALLASGIDWTGAWSAGTYTYKQAADHEGNAWIVNTTSTTEEPTDTPTDWDLLAQKGDTGDQGVQGDPGADGAEAFVYVAYASDDSGTGFTLTFSDTLDYIAILSTDTEISSPVVGDFAGLWKNYKGEKGDPGTGEVPGGTENNIVTIDGSDQIQDSGIPIASVPGVTAQVVVITDEATPSFDASDGNPYLTTVFTISATDDRALQAPSNPTNGQKVIIAHHASGAARTLSLATGAGGFIFGTDVTGITETESGKRDLIGCIYNSTLARWLVVAYTKGYEVV